MSRQPLTFADDLRHIVFFDSAGRRTPVNYGLSTTSNPRAAESLDVSPAGGAAAPSRLTLEPAEQAFIVWLFRRFGLDAGRYKAETLKRRLPACLRAIRRVGRAGPLHGGGIVPFRTGGARGAGDRRDRFLPGPLCLRPSFVTGTPRVGGQGARSSRTCQPSVGRRRRVALRGSGALDAPTAPNCIQSRCSCPNWACWGAANCSGPTVAPTRSSAPVKAFTTRPPSAACRNR